MLDGNNENLSAGRETLYDNSCKISAGREILDEHNRNLSAGLEILDENSGILSQRVKYSTSIVETYTRPAK